MKKRLKASERRASILAVAKVLFADRGYNGVAVDEIARRLGVSPAVLYQHFSSKEELYEEVLNQISADRESYIEAALNGPDDFASVLERMAQVFASKLSQDSDYLRMELQAALENAQLALRLFENRWKSFTDFIEFYINDYTRQGKLKQLNAEIASLCYQGALREALYTRLILNSERYRRYSIEELVSHITRFFLESIEARGLIERDN